MAGATNTIINNHPHGPPCTVAELLKIKFYKRNVCVVLGIPLNINNEDALRSDIWFGNFGNIIDVFFYGENIKKDQAFQSKRALITFETKQSAINAIKYINNNNFKFENGRKLKALFKSANYCELFLLPNQQCTNHYCHKLHCWLTAEDVATTKELLDFQNIAKMPYGIHKTILKSKVSKAKIKADGVPNEQQQNKQLRRNITQQQSFITDEKSTGYNYNYNNYNIYNDKILHEGIETVIVRHKSGCIHAINRLISYNPCVVGFDLEWKRQAKKVSLMQIAFSQQLIILIRLYLLSSVPGELISFLKNSKIIKCGVGIHNDKTKLMDDYDVEMFGCVDLNDIYGNNKSRCSLEKMYKLVLNQDMKYKKNINHWKWEKTRLDKRQIDYAANDALVAYEIFMKIFNDSNADDILQFCFGKIRFQKSEKKKQKQKQDIFEYAQTSNQEIEKYKLMCFKLEQENRNYKKQYAQLQIKCEKQAQEVIYLNKRLLECVEQIGNYDCLCLKLQQEITTYKTQCDMLTVTEIDELKNENKNNLCEKRFKYWLCDIVRLKQYLSIFVKNEYNDITMVEYIDEDIIKNELGITTQIHIKLLLTRIDEFKRMRQEFKALLTRNKALQQFERNLTNSGILTIDALKKYLKTNKDVQRILKINNKQEIQQILSMIYFQI